MCLYPIDTGQQQRASCPSWGVGGLDNIAKQLGLTEQQASAGANALLPGLISAFQQQAGNADLGSLLGNVLGGAFDCV